VSLRSSGSANHSLRVDAEWRSVGPTFCVIEPVSPAAASRRARVGAGELHQQASDEPALLDFRVTPTDVTAPIRRSPCRRIGSIAKRAALALSTIPAW
jgi:hypothetical protein